jgi:hypothetical protein
LGRNADQKIGAAGSDGYVRPKVTHLKSAPRIVFLGSLGYRSIKKSEKPYAHIQNID